MREITKRYSNEIRELSKVAIDENGNFINGYDSKILDFLNEYSQKIFYDVKAHTENKSRRYEDLLTKLEILYYLLDEEGYAFANNLIGSITDNKWRTEAKIRLFMMFVKRLADTNYLLKGGYASGALSITRGIYEIGVYLEIILNNDEIIAEKFLKHSNNDRLKIAKSLIDMELENRITKQIEDLEFGDKYLRDYGWAKSLIGSKISFYKLAQLTELSKYYHMYTYCCSSVHASILDSVNGIDINKADKGKSVWITTSSEEGIKTVISILMCFSNSVILKYFDKFDLNTGLIMILLKDIGEVFLDFNVTDKEITNKRAGIALRVDGKIVGSTSFFGIEEATDIPQKLLKRIYGEIVADGLLGYVNMDWTAILQNSIAYQDISNFIYKKLHSALKQFIS